MKNTTLHLNIIRKNSKLLLENLKNPYRQVFEAMMGENVIKATKFISPGLILRMVRTRSHKKIDNRSNISISLTIGKPNFLEREFIKLAQEAKEPFPIKMVQLKLYSPKTRNLKKK